MDVLSRIVELSRLRPVLDIRCQLGGGFHIDHDRAGRGWIPFHLVLGGSCIISTAAGKRLELQSGDFLLLPHGDAHAISSVVGGPAFPVVISHDGAMPLRHNLEHGADVDLLCGHFECASGSSDFLLSALPNPFHTSLLGSHSEETLRTVITLLHREATEDQPGALTIITALCLALFIMALRTPGASPMATSGLLSLLAAPRLVRSVSAIAASPARRWTIEDLAGLSAMSRAAYARHFKASSGMTVISFLTELRMAIASDLLMRTRRNAGDIAAEVGYDSEAAFGKVFKASKGLSPARFRHQNFVDNTSAETG